MSRSASDGARLIDLDQDNAADREIIIIFSFWVAGNIVLLLLVFLWRTRCRLKANSLNRFQKYVSAEEVLGEASRVPPKWMQMAIRDAVQFGTSTTEKLQQQRYDEWILRNPSRGASAKLRRRARSDSNSEREAHTPKAFGPLHNGQGPDLSGSRYSGAKQSVSANRQGSADRTISGAYVADKSKPRSTVGPSSANESRHASSRPDSLRSTDQESNSPKVARFHSLDNFPSGSESARSSLPGTPDAGVKGGDRLATLPTVVVTDHTPTVAQAPFDLPNRVGEHLESTA